jgi:hypothetical protein
VREADGAGRGKPLTVLSGMSGIGKTVLAARLGQSCRLRRSFADGVLFTRAGPSATGLDLVNDLRRRLGDVPGAGEGLDEAARVLAGMARRGRRLVIVDDVWYDKQLLPVIGALAASASQIIATSRQTDLGAGVEGAVNYDVTLPTAEQAWRLLLDAAKAGHEDAPGEAETIVERCGRLPLALAICGAHLRRGGSWAQLLAGLEAYDPGVLELPLAAYEHPGVFAAMRVALAELQEHHPRLADRYQSLGLFSPGDATPLPVIFRVWACGSAAGRREAELDLAELHSRSLLTFRSQGAHVDEGSVVLHDLQRAFLVRSGPPLADLASQLLDAYAPAGDLDGLAGAACQERWLRGHLVELLVTAGRLRDLELLLTAEGDQAENHWHRLRADAGELDGYESDLARWAEATARAEDPVRIGRLARIAMIRSSLASTARHTPANLAVAAVRAHLWHPHRAMATARRLPHDTDRARAMIEVLEVVPEPDRESWLRAVLAELAELAPRDQAAAVAALPGTLHPAELERVTGEWLRHVEDQPARSRLPGQFAPFAAGVSGEAWTRAWNAAADSEQPSAALATLTAGLPGNEAERLVLDLLGDFSRLDQANTLHHALSGKSATERPVLRTEVAWLLHYATRNAPSIPEVADSIALGLLIPHAPAEAVAACLRAYPGATLGAGFHFSPLDLYELFAPLARAGGAVDEIAEFARALTPDYLGTGLLAEVAAGSPRPDPALVAEVGQRLLEHLREDTGLWLDDIAASVALVASGFSTEVRTALLATAELLAADPKRAAGLAALLPALPAGARGRLLGQALTALASTPTGSDVAKALRALTPEFTTKELKRALRTAAAARDDGFERSGLKQLTDRLDATDRVRALKWVLSVAASHLGDPSQAGLANEHAAVELLQDALAEHHSAPLLDTATALLDAVTQPRLRAKGHAALAAAGHEPSWHPVDDFIGQLAGADAYKRLEAAELLLKHLSGARRARLIALASPAMDQVDNPYTQARAFVTLAGDVDVGQRVRNLLTNVKGSSLDGMLEILAPLLDHQSASICLRRSEDLSDQVGVLAERLAELGELDAGVSLARPSPSHASQVFTAIAARLPLDEVRKALAEHRWEARLWEPDGRLAARLAQLGQVDEALSVLAGLPPGEARYRATALVGRHLRDGPDRQVAVMGDLEHIDYVRTLWSALKESAPLLAQLPAEPLLGAYRRILDRLGDRIRLQALPGLYNISPIIDSLGGRHAMRETLEAVIDVSRWWPSYPPHDQGSRRGGTDS